MMPDYRVFDRVKNRMAHSFVKKVVAEDGTEYSFLAFNFTLNAGFPDLVTLPQVENEPKRYVLMSFVGKHDKTGKAIYESDVLNLTCGAHEVLATVEWDEVGFVARVHEDKILVVGGSKDGEMLPEYEIHSWAGMHTCLREWDSKREVVGNIYEV